MRKHLSASIISGLLLTLIVTFSHSEEVGTPAHDRAFEAYLDGLVAAQFDDYELAGMTFVMVHGDQITLAKGYGAADLVSGEPVDPSRHLFRPGSVSKLFTWTAVMQLVEQGRLDLNADVSEYVHQFTIPNAFDTPMTLTHIMTHAPGLEDGAAGFLFARDESDLRPLAESLGAHIPTQVRPPGKHAAYSNWASALAGLIVANVSGMSFEDYVSQHILTPLQMTHATFEEPLPTHLAGDMATGYISEQSSLQATGFEFIKNFGPAGALSAAGVDMGHFMIAHLNGGRFGETQLLKPATVERMHSRLFQHHEAVTAMAHGFIESQRNGQRFIGHAGDTIAFHSSMVMDPERRFGFFLSFNAPDGARARDAISNGIIDYFYPPSPPRYVFEPTEDNAVRIAEVVGGYRMNRRSYTELEGILALGGDLPVIPAGEGAIQIPVPEIGGKFYEVTPYVFQQVGGQSRLVFTRNDEGEIAHMLLGDMPIIVGDKVSAFTSAANHQLILILTLLASLFVTINTVRNRKDGLGGKPARGRFLVTSAAVANLAFLAGLGVIVAASNMQNMVFDFPPSGVGFVLIFPLVSLGFTLGALYYLWPIWKAPEYGRWPSLRYSYVVVLFVLYLSVLNYWNLIGWNY
ncbi:MAG: serine hydrolase domain-containing protein [Pseudomonadota bacterium]|nr:serine hydrolase domain-containing protein [Pseudomonadota bacterium]